MLVVLLLMGCVTLGNGYMQGYYEMGNAGVEGCISDGYVAVINEEECKTAAGEFGGECKNAEKDGIYEGKIAGGTQDETCVCKRVYTRGGLTEPVGFYLSTRYGVKANWVCKPGYYFDAGIEENECPEGFVRITSPVECAKAMDDLCPSGCEDRTTHTNDDGDHNPKGCHRSRNSNIWRFNTHAVGGPRDTKHLICKRSPCNLPEILGGSWESGCDSLIVSGETCYITADSGYWCDNAKSTTCTSGKLDFTPTCTGCPDVSNGICTECSDANICTTVTCKTNYFNDDNDATNGCEAGCPVISNGICTECTDANTCTTVTCKTNYFNDDNNAANGCEAEACGEGEILSSCVCEDDLRNGGWCLLDEYFERCANGVILSSCVCDGTKRTDGRCEHNGLKYYCANGVILSSCVCDGTTRTDGRCEQNGRKYTEKCEDGAGRGKNYCSEWCNTLGVWGCGVVSHKSYICDCTGCNNC